MLFFNEIHYNNIKCVVILYFIKEKKKKRHYNSVIKNFALLFRTNLL